MSLNIFTVFLVIGISIPFFPLWLEGRNLSADDIGLILAVALWAKAPVGIWVTSVADATGERKRLQIITSVVVLQGIILISQLHGFWPLLLAWAVIGTLMTTAIPLADSIIVTAVKSMSVDYGKIRVWGSISFIFVSLTGGWYLSDKDSEQIIILLMVGAVAMIIGAVLLPNLKELPRISKSLASFDLIKRPGFVLFIFTAAVLQSSHAALYGFASLSWVEAGISGGTIGLLWAEGVIVEILVFTFSARLLHRLSVPQMLLCAAIAGIIRWSVIGSTAWLPALIMVQGLHAVTFAVTHLAAITYITKNIPHDQSASAQGLYDSLAMGFVFGIAMVLSGWLYVDYGRSTFFAMIVFSALGAIGALVMMKRSHSIQ